MNIKQRCSLLGLCLSLSYMTWAQPIQGTLVDKIVAKVDNQIILHSEVEIAFQQYLLQGAEETLNLKCEILERLILNKALLAKAKQEGIAIAKEELSQKLDQTIRYFVAQVGSEAGLVQYWGKPMAEIKSELRERVQEQMMIEKISDQVISEVSATPQEVKAFFEALPSHERPYYPTEVVVRHIVQYPQASQQEKETLLAQLKALKVRLQNGEQFEVLAREYSQDPGSASQGGELGFWRLGELAPAYEAAALALQPGEVSEPVETQFGLHLIQLIAQEKDRYNSRHILLKPSPKAADIEAAKTSLTQLRASILAGKLTFEEAARISSADISTALVGGLITGKQGNVKMVIDELPSGIFFAVEELTPGSISDPVVFTTPEGRQAARILLLEEKWAPHEANLAQDYAKIQQLLIDKKRASALQTWFKEVQTSASIKVAPEYQGCEPLK